MFYTPDTGEQSTKIIPNIEKERKRKTGAFGGFRSFFAFVCAEKKQKASYLSWSCWIRSLTRLLSEGDALTSPATFWHA